MLGNAANLRLLFRKAPIVEKNAYERIQPDEASGLESYKQQNNAKVFC